MSHTLKQQESTFKEPESQVISSGTATDTTITDSPTFNPPTAPQQLVEQQKESPFIKEVKEVILNISQDHYNKIIEQLKKDQLRFEFIDNSGNIKQDLKTYVPMTIGQNKKVGKVLKRERLVREDVNAFLEKSEGALSVEQIKQKYNDVFDDDLDETDLSNKETFNEIISNYSVAQKAKIYWGIESIENYTLNDLILIIALYESRNGLGTPSS